MRLKYCIGPYMVWASSFKHLDYKWNWMYKRNTQIYMYMIFFHTNSNGCDVEFFADSFYDSLYWFLNWFRKTFSSIFRNPYYVIPAVIDSMWCFSVHHVDLYWVMYTLDTLVTIGLKANRVLDPRMEIKISIVILMGLAVITFNRGFGQEWWPLFTMMWAGVIAFVWFINAILH